MLLSLFSRSKMMKASLCVMLTLLTETPANAQNLCSRAQSRSHPTSPLGRLERLSPLLQNKARKTAAQEALLQNRAGNHKLRATEKAEDSHKAVLPLDFFNDDDPLCRPKGIDIKPHEDKYDAFMGTAEFVALSPDGTSMTVGYHLNVMDSIPHGFRVDNSGFRVFTYTYVERTYEWIRYGDEKGAMKIPLEQHSEWEYAGASLRMTANLVAVPHSHIQFPREEYGNLTAHGAVNLWAFDKFSTRWSSILTLEPPNEEQECSLFGSDVAIVESDDVLLTRLVVGMPASCFNSTGRVQVYELQAQGDEDTEEYVWVPFGPSILGEELEFGSQVKASQDGSIVAVSGTHISSNDQDEQVFDCMIRVFSVSMGSNSDVTWSQLGQDLKSSSDEDGLVCSTMTLSGDGTTVIVGPHSYDPHCPMTPPDPVGHVRAWRFEGDKWVQKGSDFDTLIPMPDSAYDFGYDISVSKDGNRVAVSLRLGYVHVPAQIPMFEWDETTNDWTVVGGYVSSRTPAFFTNTAMSDDGQTLLLGFRSLDAGGIARAHKCHFKNKEMISALDEF